jgi:lipopolysaccharide transport system permease protein
MAKVGTREYVPQRILPMRVRILHWLIVLITGLVSLAIALPSVLAQPTLYTSSAVIRFDREVFPDLIMAGRSSAVLQAYQQSLSDVLVQTQYPMLFHRGLQYQYPADGKIVVIAETLNPELAPQIARDAAEGLARWIYTGVGTPLLQAVLESELQAALNGRPVASREDQVLRNVLHTRAVDGVALQPADRSLDSLTRMELMAVARALEVQEKQNLIKMRRAEQAMLNSRTDAQRAQAHEERQRAENEIDALRLLQAYLRDTYNINLDIYAVAPVYVAQAASSATVVPTYGALRLALAAVFGMLGGVLTVLIDRQVGILTKLQELWSYRELVRNMVVRDLKARYKNSVLGYIWSLLNPLLMMCVFWFAFSVLLRNPIPMFPIFLIVALLPWSYALTSIGGGMRSILDHANLVKKVYFPREILPITVVLSNLVNYIFALPVMFLVMAIVQYLSIGRLNFSLTFAFLPVIIVIQTIFLIGIVLLLSTLAVFFRDTTHIVDILMQLWIFVTPIFFSLEQIVSPTLARLVRWINPMASIVDFYRDVLYGQASNPNPGLPALDAVFRTLLTALIILALGAYVFHRYSGRFGEEI